MASILLVLFSLIGLVMQLADALDPDITTEEPGQTSYGIIILLIVVIFREVREIFRGFSQAVKDDKMVAQVNELHAWHNVLDKDGTRIWYVKGSLEESIRELTGVIRKLPGEINKKG